MFFPHVKNLLSITGVQIPAHIFRLPQGPPLGRTNGAHVEVYWFFLIKLGVLYDDCVCGLVLKVPGYRSRAPGSIPGATRFSEK
jgi:hypothetical protein